MYENTIIRQSRNIHECRICGLIFMPGLEEDRERHELEHRKIIAGGVPFAIRELLKARGWEIARGDDLSRRELGKRAVVFGWWQRAVSNGVPENDLESYMSAHFAMVDAQIESDAEGLKRADEGLSRWVKYGG